MPSQILLVDDDRDIAEGVRLRLTAAGYNCTLAADGDSGLTLATAEAPQVILLDLRLPKRDGIAVLHELKRRPATMNIPVIVVSASLVEQQNALDAGAHFFLSKPYSGTLLLTSIRYALAESCGGRWQS
jgi:DNA-binding response OmpR family regulator